MSLCLRMPRAHRPTPRAHRPTGLQVWWKACLITGCWRAGLILAAKEENASSHSSGRKNAMQMLLEAKDEDGAMVSQLPTAALVCA